MAKPYLFSPSTTVGSLENEEDDEKEMKHAEDEEKQRNEGSEERWKRRE